MFKDAIKGILWSINALLSSMLKSSLLFESIENFNPTLYRQVLDIADIFIHTIALTIITLCALLEVLKIAYKTEGAGISNDHMRIVEVICRLMFKVVLCTWVIQNAPELLVSVFNMFLRLLNVLSARISVASFNGNMLDLDSLNNLVDHMGVGDQMLSLIVGFIVLLVVAVVVIMVNVIVIGRLIEIYIMLAVSPIPISTVCHDEFSSIAKNFFKSFVAICLQGILLYIVLSFFPAVINSMIAKNVSFLGNLGGDTFALKLLSVLGYVFVLALALFSTQKWSKSICNAI